MPKLKSVRLKDVSAIKHDISVADIGYVRPGESRPIVVLRFKGTYGIGSSGAPDCRYLAAVEAMAQCAWEPLATVIDLRKLDYSWGGEMSRISSSNRWGDRHLVVSERCSEGIRTLHLNDTDSARFGISCLYYVHFTLESALTEVRHREECLERLLEIEDQVDDGHVSHPPLHVKTKDWEIDGGSSSTAHVRVERSLFESAPAFWAALASVTEQSREDEEDLSWFPPVFLRLNDDSFAFMVQRCLPDGQESDVAGDATPIEAYVMRDDGWVTSVLWSTANHWEALVRWDNSSVGAKNVMDGRISHGQIPESSPRSVGGGQ